jgi:hypothetical protein
MMYWLDLLILIGWGCVLLALAVEAIYSGSKNE